MTKVRVIYINQTSGEVEESTLKELIVRGEIAAYCGPTGWIGVRDECGMDANGPDSGKRKEKE